jgi:hypothetical protein
MDLKQSVTDNPVKYATGVLAFVAAIGGAVAAVPKIEPVFPAHRLYVREEVRHVHDTIQMAQDASIRALRDVQVEQAEGKREAADDALATWQLKLSGTTDETAKQLIRERIRALENTQRKLDGQINTLNRLRGQP